MRLLWHRLEILWLAAAHRRERDWLTREEMARIRWANATLQAGRRQPEARDPQPNDKDGMDLLA